MGRFKINVKSRLAVGAAAVALMASGAAATPCTDGGAAVFCQWSSGCYSIDDEYGTPAGLTCTQYIANCVKDGWLYTGVTGLDDTNDYGKDLDCDDVGGSFTGRGKSETPPGSSDPILGCCKWDTESACYVVKDPIEAADCGGGDNVWWETSAGCSEGSTSSYGANCPTTTPAYDGSGNSQVEGVCKNSSGVPLFCQWVDGCYAIDARYGEPTGLTCAEYVAACASDGLVYTGVTGLTEENNYGEGLQCSDLGGSTTSIRHVTARSHVVTPLLSVKGRTLTIAPSAQDSRVRVRVINMKGRVVARHNVKTGQSITLSKKLSAGSYIIEARRAADGMVTSSRIRLD